ncbi:hypothetical protein [Anabaena lutea]|uniref:Uncharacterized protein n=1 Tax=Anabaena lutea FACHB-196 TaxID=2692881 RepID=A0ABR8FHH1_9NOST|nr:hypothetical protein [Anabaena lutea]MBD2568359.1 hypothetical protein [Anabaena lutea FACHB-196]
MTSPWRLAARSAIRSAIAQLPPDCDRIQIKKAIDAAYPFGAREYHPYKIWLSERADAFHELGLLDPKKPKPKMPKKKKPPINPDGVVDGQLSLW